MEFAPGKSELIHFSRTRNPLADRVRLGNTTKGPTTSTRFLGVWLDRKLTWKAHLKQSYKCESLRPSCCCASLQRPDLICNKPRTHLKEVQQKPETQRLALTRLVAASWGFSLARSREVYTKVLCNPLRNGVWSIGLPQGDRAGRECRM
jgi:hypothetical protein